MGIQLTLIDEARIDAEVAEVESEWRSLLFLKIRDICRDYEAALAERDATIAELRGRIEFLEQSMSLDAWF